MVDLLLSLVAVRRELHSDCLALLQAPHIQEEAQLKLPLDINNYPFYRYVQIYFRVRQSYLKKICFSQLGGIFLLSMSIYCSKILLIATGTKVWDADGTPKVTSDAAGG